MLPDMLRRDRERWGMSVGEAGWRLGWRKRSDARYCGEACKKAAQRARVA